MNSHEVIDNLVRGKKAERVGVYDGPWGDTVRLWVEQGYPVDENGKPVDFTDHFDFDIAWAGGAFDILPLRGVLETVEETDEWVVRRNGAGASLKWWKRKSSTREHVDFRMTSREIWERDYRSHLLEVDRERVDIEGTRAALEKRRSQNRWTIWGQLFIWENMRQSMGDLCLYESVLTDPEWIHDYNRVNTDFFINHYRLLIEEAGPPDGYWAADDLGYCNGLFCSPQVLEDLIFPYYKEFVDFWHSYDIPVVLHSCGNITEALPLIVQAGFDALNPMEAKAGCDLLRFAEQYGDKLAFSGGLDVRVLESGDRDFIRSEVTRIVEGMKARGARYIFGCDHSLSTNIRYDDFRYALEVYREHMMY